jgi:hypothetical protein
MEPILVTCPACGGQVRLRRENGNSCPCGVMINVFHGSQSQMVHSLKESWDYREQVEAKPYSFENREAVAFNLGGDLKVIALKTSDRRALR